MAEKESNNEVKLYTDLGSLKKLAFHVIVGDYAMNIYHDLHLETKAQTQKQLNYCLAGCYFLGKKPSELEFMMDYAMNNYLSFLYQIPEECIENTEIIQSYKIVQ